MTQTRDIMGATREGGRMVPTTRPARPNEIVGVVTISQTATVAISAGVRSLTLNLVGAEVGDKLLLFPASVPAGYLLQAAPVVTAKNKVRVSLLAPLLAIGASYSITCQVVRIDAA